MVESVKLHVRPVLARNNVRAQDMRNVRNMLGPRLFGMILARDPKQSLVLQDPLSKFQSGSKDKRVQGRLAGVCPFI